MTFTAPHYSTCVWARQLLAREPHQIIPSADDPYLRRWHLVPRNRFINVYLHQFLRSDDDRALHDHPWWFASLMLHGSYTEVTEGARTPRSAPEPWRLFFGDRPFAFRRATWRHRVELIPLSGPDLRRIGELPCWTLIVTGRRSRLRGFWCKRPAWPGAQPRHYVERFVPWNEFGDAGCGETA